MNANWLYAKLLISFTFVSHQRAGDFTQVMKMYKVLEIMLHRALDKNPRISGPVFVCLFFFSELNFV